MSDGRLNPRYLPKPEGDGCYKPSKHMTNADIPADYALIDDIVETGVGMSSEAALKWARGREPLAVIANFWYKVQMENGPLARFKDRIYIISEWRK